MAGGSPMIYGGGEVLPAQAVAHLKACKPFIGCNAGHTFFHVDPFGSASICKVGRDEQISLVDDGVDGLAQMGAIEHAMCSCNAGDDNPY